MERNTLLAILLSTAVLFGYQAIFSPPKPVDVPTNSQSIENTNLTTQVNSATGASVQKQDITTDTFKNAEYYKIKTSDKEFSYTNVGGTLHNVDFFRNNSFPITDVLNIDGLETAQYEGQQVGDKTVTLIYQDKNWQISKTYFLKGDSLLNVRVEIKNLSEISILENFSFTAFDIDENRMEINQNNRENALFEYSVYSNGKMFRKGSATKFNDKSFRQQSTSVTWVGFRDHYHAFIVKPQFETKGYEIKALNDKELNITIKPADRNLGPGESAIYNFSIYSGVQNPWNMKKLNEGFEKIVAFSNFPIIEWIGQAIYHIIPFFHGIFKSWGVAIILISLLIYGVTYPLTMQSMMSMRKMQEIQPKISALKERYKNDPQKLNAETVEIYRREKINPFGGCLPFLIQMPFFMALYQILWRAQYFQGQGFLWIKDLSMPDRLIILPFYLPFLGNELNILPILTGGIMFIQQRISTKNMIVTDEQQIMQQKMTMYILPVMMTFMFYKFASSWAIYFLVFYILSTLSQWKIAQLSTKKKVM